MESKDRIHVHYSTVPDRRRHYSEEAIKSEQNEVRGVVILMLCALYAISMFLVAKLVSRLLSAVLASVRSVCFSMNVNETKLTEDKCLQQTSLSPSVRKQLQARPLNHG